MYISACEAAWRLFGFDIQKKEPPVIRLPFHLPNEQSVVYKDDACIETILENAESRKSMFVGWMEANRKYLEARNLTYAEFPTKFVWKEKEHEWIPRKQAFVIGRITHVPSCNGEDYYLRLLLNIQKGCMQYKDIMIVNGTSYSSFKDACLALGLLQDDREFIDAIKEAATWASSPYLRRLFVVLLISKNMSRPEFVWDQVWLLLSDDILHKHKQMLRMDNLILPDDELKELTLEVIEELLQCNGRTLSEFPPMPIPTNESSNTYRERMIIEELNFDKIALSDMLHNMLNSAIEEQRVAHDKIMDAVYSNSGGFYFLYGYGGTGKTFVWNMLLAAIRSMRDIVLNVASSSIASLLLPNGRTAHSRFKIPLNIAEDSTCGIKQGTPHAKLLSKAKLIIWDEAPILSRFCFEALDKCLRDILRYDNSYNLDLPFGGKVVVLGGDFRQILPVIPRGSRQDIVHATINSSYLWEYCEVLVLSRNMRLSVGSDEALNNDIKKFSEWLLKIGDGLAGDSTDGELEILIPAELLILNSDNALDELIEFVYPNILQNIGFVDYFKDRSILAPTLDIVNDINDHVMSCISGEHREYLSSDSICVEEGNMDNQLDAFSPEILNGLNCSGLPPHRLLLKVGVPVMLLRNIDQSNGLCNGTRLQVKRLGCHVIECSILTGNKIGEVVLIPRMTMIPNNETIPIKFKRQQFHLVVSFAMTINKSQGQTLSYVGLYLPRPVFTHGQLYVALSRVKSKKGLRILLQNHADFSPNCTINVVYREVFDKLK